ncbi:hypothetical protein V1512DRAFT_267694 [Lipomyces arxii]|uniref:uncharacterized protein n=1 Tax=Lipomyces arxii TaxID=56418 RepID=UPI0034CDB497
MSFTPVRKLAVHHDRLDNDDGNKENVPPFSTSTTTTTPHTATTRPSRPSESLLKTAVSRRSTRAPLREIYLSSPSTPENAYVEYYLPETDVVDSPIPSPNPFRRALTIRPLTSALQPKPRDVTNQTRDKSGKPSKTKQATVVGKQTSTIKVPLASKSMWEADKLLKPVSGQPATRKPTKNKMVLMR